MFRIIRGVAASLAFLSLAATSAQTSLTVWTWRTEDVATFEMLAATFERENPGIRVVFTPYLNAEYNTIVNTALLGGGGPDIVQLRAYGGMEQLARAGVLVPLDGEVRALEAFDPVVLLGATSRSDGRVYGVPLALHTVQALYNVDLFERLGLTEPATWDEFLAVGDALMAHGVNALANGTRTPWTVELLFGGVGPSYYGCTPFFQEITSGATDFSDPRFVTSLERIAELRPYLADDHANVDHAQMQELFASERAGMLIGGTRELGNVTRLNPDLRIGAFAVPAEHADAPSCISHYVDSSFGLNANSRHREAALRFLHFLATPRFGQPFTDELQQLSPVPGVVPGCQTLAGIAELVNEKGTPYLMLSAFRHGSPSGSALLQNELKTVLDGDQAATDAVTSIQQGVAQWFEPFQR